MQFYERKAVCAPLTNYCHLAEPHSVIEVTEWHNGEGWDVWIDSRLVQLTHGELTAITVLCNIKHQEQK